MKSAFLLLVVALALTAAERTFDRCSLARELDRLGVPRFELPNWNCIADRATSYRTSVVSPSNSDGSKSYGIFQISSLYWCKPAGGGFSHNFCQIDCNSLLTDDISNSIKCAQQVKRKQGWGAWAECSNDLLSVNDCF